MTTKSKKGRKFSHESEYSKAMMNMDMNMKYSNFASQHMSPVNQLMSSNHQHLSSYSPYTSASFQANFGQAHHMPSYPAWSPAAPNGFGLPTSMVGAAIA